jgi:hypothetical protein
MTKVNLSTSVGIASSGYLSPSGDTTGATDTATINSVLMNNKSVVLRGVPGGTPFWINAPMVMHSSNTLILMDAHVKLVANANCNVLTNYNATLTGSGQTQNYAGTADTTLRVKGIGLAWLDGNVANQQAAFTTGNTTTQAGIQWVNASDVRVDDVRIGPFIWMAGVQIGCTKMRWSRIDINQDRSVPHQDGIDIGPGCSDILIENCTGQSSDDCHSIWAKYGPSSGGANITLWTTAAYSASSTNLNTTDVRIIGSKMAVGINFLRCQAGDGATLRGVHAADLVNTEITPYSTLSCVLQLGGLNYVTTAPSPSQLIDIVVDGVSGSFPYVIGCDSYFDDVKVVNAQITGPFTALFGHTGSTATSGNRIDIDVVTTDTVGLNNYGLYTISGDAFDQLRLRAKMASSKGVLVNSGAVTNLDADVFVDNPTGSPIQSSTKESGSLRLNLGAHPSVIFAAQSALMIREAPYLTANDTVPVSTINSQIVCRADLDPTGSGYTNGAKYIGDGTVWNRLIELPNLVVANSIAFVKLGGHTSSGGVSSLSITVPSGGHAAGNVVIVAISTSTSSTPTSVTDSAGNTWTIDKSQQSGSYAAALAHCRLTTALSTGATITVNLSANANSAIIDSAEFTGMATTGIADQSATNNNATAVATLDGGTTSTTSQSRELAVAAFSISGSTGGSTAGSGSTILNDITYAGGVTRALVWEYSILSSSSAVDQTATITTPHAYTSVTQTYRGAS